MKQFKKINKVYNILSEKIPNYPRIKIKVIQHSATGTITQSINIMTV